jgi:hypothetical protein
MGDGRFDGVEPSVNPTDSLDKTYWVPVDIVVDDAFCLLHVDALAEDVGADEDVYFSFFVISWQFVVEWAKAVEDFGSGFLVDGGVNAFGVMVGETVFDCLF